MILIFGGAYQGKLEYALKTYPGNVSICHCHIDQPDIDFTKDIIDKLHYWVLVQLRNNTDPCPFIVQHIDLLKSKIIICDDISCGIVPIDTEMRAWRESVGQVLKLLASYADEVIRIFCGLGTRIK